MAKFDLAFPYKTRAQTAGVLIFTSMFSASVVTIELLIGFAVLEFLWSLAAQGAGPAQLHPGFLSMLMLAATACVFAMLGLVLCWDEQIQLSDRGLSMPNLFMFPMFGRTQRSWEDFQSLQLGSREGLSLDRQVLTVRFRTGGRARIDLAQLSTDSIEQLLLSFEVWARNAQKDALLLRLQSGLHDLKLGRGQLSYTQLWEEEMNRRFGSTAFIPLEPGRTLQSGRLRVLKQLAFGGLSAIYLAQLNRVEAVVLKESVLVDASDTSQSEKAKELFAREAELLAQLDHPQIARLRDYFIEDGRHYVLLDYLPGDDLKKIVKTRGAQSEHQVLGWTLELAYILAYLHGRQPVVLHRDLTPDNIVWSGNQIVLIDFGAANQLLTTATGTLIGKQSYIAPEQFRGNAEPASDIYSLGCTMHFLLTGEEPEPLSVSHPRSLCSSVSPQVDALVAACTQFEVSERVKTATELIERIELLLGVSARGTYDA